MAAQSAARVRRPTAAELAAVPSEEEGATAVEREVEAEGDGGYVVPLDTDDGTIDILVPPAEEWRDSAIEAMQTGRFGLWAQKTLGEDDYAAWRDADPRVRQVNAFFAELGRLTGVTQGNSPLSGPRSPRTRRR